MFLSALSLALLLLPALACAYHVFLALAARFGRSDNLAANSPPRHSFAIVIPAHNEEAGIADTLRSCAALDYPQRLYQTYVVADNCTDRTAVVAARAGAAVLERTDDERRGKGHALEWAFEHVLQDGQDAVVVLDADCRLDAHALRSFDVRLSAGAEVLQANYVTSNPDASATSYALAVGNHLENDWFYAPKSRLGLAVFLRGTGMVLRRGVLERHPWRAYSVTEDVEYSLALLRDGVRIHYLANVNVSSAFPEHSRQLCVQRTRWAAGNAQLGWSSAIRLLAEGMLRRHGGLVDAGWTLLVLSRPLLLLHLLVTLVVTSLNTLLAPGLISRTLLGCAVTVAAVQAGYFMAGVLHLGVTRRRLGLLLGSVAVVPRLVSITLRGAARGDSLAWTQTPRESAGALEASRQKHTVPFP